MVNIVEGSTVHLLRRMLQIPSGHINSKDFRRQPDVLLFPVGVGAAVMLFSDCEVYFDCQGPLCAAANGGCYPVAGRRLILEAHPQNFQLFSKRVPAFCCLCRCFGGGLYGLGAFICRSLDQPELVGGICLGPLECGNEFSMRNGWVHSYSHINQRRDSSILTLARSKAVLNSRVAGLAISTF